MKVLFIGDDSAVGRAAATVRGAGHAVQVARRESAMAGQFDVGVDVVVRSVGGRDDPLLDDVKQLRARAAPHLMLYLLGAPLAAEPSVIAYDAGVDGELGLCPDARLLLARLAAAERQVLARQGKRRCCRGSAAIDESPTAALGQSTSWSNAPTVIAGAAQRFLTLPFTVEDAADDVAADLAQVILLAGPLHGLEVRIAIAASRESALVLANHLFGVEEGPALTLDLLGELANILMGAMKASLAGEALAFTGGLPIVSTVAEALRPASAYRLQRRFALRTAGATLVFHLGLRCKENQALTPTSLREGMVTARDIVGPTGVLLVNRGTRLSEHMVERLRTFLTASDKIEVMAP